jgi:methylase of polypeptide subunit release factors
VLEIGVGEAALLAIFVERRFGVAVDGVDISSARVASSKRIVAFNGGLVRIWQSDVFEQVQQSYELILSNPPYVPTATGHALGLTARVGLESDGAWDGGRDGTDVLARIVEGAPAHLVDGGLLLLGVQPVHVDDVSIERLLAESRFTILARERPWYLPSVVWVLRKG